LFTYLFDSDRAGIVGILLVLGAGLLALLPVKPPPLSAIKPTSPGA
jgi:UMF1 family MFS transporter